MPDKQTIEKAKRDKTAGKSASTQAGEFVKAEMDKIRSGKTGARSAKQAIAIGLSEARRSGVDLKPPVKGKTSEKTRKSAKSAYEKGQRQEPISATRSAASQKAMKKEGTAAASTKALSRQAGAAAQRRSAADRSASAKKAARTRAQRGR
ncbi:MAG: DNA-binding protein [Bacteroidetes bacterium]|nr:DNA-binding protein [Bacteroidota bacterium]